MSGLKITLPAPCAFILSRLHENGFEAYAVGGCVRDTLLGDIRTACPASILRRHPAATLYLDADSASLL